MKKMQKKDIKPDKSKSSRKSNNDEHEQKVASSDETKGILSKINGKAEKE